MTPNPPTTDEAVFVIGDGNVTALAGGPLSLADMGPRTTRRASRLEFNAALNVWEVLPPAGGAPLYSHEDYDIALKWEHRHFNAVLRTGTAEVSA